MSERRPTVYRRATLIAVALAFVLVATAGAAVEYPVPSDQDNDGVVDAADSCRSIAGDLKNGCPSELNAEVRGRWRVNALLSQLLSLTVRAPTGARIDVRCSGRRGACDFRRRVIVRTTRRTTSLTRHFKGRRILPARVMIVVRVTRPQQIGVYERLLTRTGRRLPKVAQRCISTTGVVHRCA